MQQVETPTAIPSGSTVQQGTEIILTCATEGAVIRYTLDGSIPDCMSGYVYTQPIVLFGQQQVTVTAVACAEGYNPSEVVQWFYSFEGGTDVQLIEAAIPSAVKKFENGQLYILMPDGHQYTILGVKIR